MTRFLVMAALIGLCAAQQDEKVFTDSFVVDPTELTTTGSNTYWILEPGYQLVLEGKEGTKEVKIVITVLDETRKVDGVETRIVEERESEDGEIIEISRNYYAISKKTSSVYYFGEDVDMYKGGKVTGHGGSWLSGEKGAKFGLMMPGTALIGARHYQEIAPEIAMDRAEILSVNEKVETKAGKFERCLKTLETTPLEKDVAEKLYAPGVGLLTDGAARLVKYGKKEK